MPRPGQYIQPEQPRLARHNESSSVPRACKSNWSDVLHFFLVCDTRRLLVLHTCQPGQQLGSPHGGALALRVWNHTKVHTRCQRQ